MLRQMIQIDEKKCNGCGLCAAACHEGAIGMVDGKAKLLRDDYCDGLGDCLPVCPTGAISFIQREAAAYDEAAVLARKAAALRNSALVQAPPGGGCPGSRSRVLMHEDVTAAPVGATISSQLRQWPVQLKLAPLCAPYFDGANLLIAADCSAFAYGNFHQEFMRGKVTLIGCPKLDGADYSEKLTEILRQNLIKSLTVVRMEVPCCGGIEQAAVTALKNSGKFLPWQVVTLSTDGRVLES